MSAEIIAILGTALVVFGALAVLVVTQNRATRRDLAELLIDIRGLRGEIGTATREIQEGEPGTESARELSSTKNPTDAL